MKLTENMIISTEKGYLNLENYKTIPNGIVFNNLGSVNLNYLENIPNDIIFNNNGAVCLFKLKELPSGIIFKNINYFVFNKNINLDKLTYKEFINIYKKLTHKDTIYLCKEDLLPLMRKKQLELILNN